MANDIIFKKKAFGGFDKEDVMNYVNTLLQEKRDVEKKLSESNSRNATLNATMLQYKKAADESISVAEEVNNLKTRVEELNAGVLEKDIQISSLNEKILLKDSEISSLNIKLSESTLTEDVQAEIETLRAEVSRLKIELEKKRDMERQVGAAMLDARIHSEELVEEAKEKANAVTKSVYTAIGETAIRIDDLSGNISEIARSFAKSVEEVELRIKALTGDMSKTAQLLISESGVITDPSTSTQSTDTYGNEYDFSAEVDSVTEITFEPTDTTEE